MTIDTSKVYAGATPEQLRHSLVREFLAIHEMFRRELDAMLRFVEGLTTGEHALTQAESAAAIQRLAGAAYQYTQLLHFHHHGESAMLFPALRREGLADPIIGRLVSEHDEIALLVDGLDQAMHCVSTVDPQALDTALRRLAEVLRLHLAYEEMHVCPLLMHFSHWPFYS